MPGPMESARMLMTENTPLMMPKDRPETTEGEGSQPRATAAVLPLPRAPGKGRREGIENGEGCISTGGSSTPPLVSDT